MRVRGLSYDNRAFCPDSLASVAIKVLFWGGHLFLFLCRKLTIPQAGCGEEMLGRRVLIPHPTDWRPAGSKQGLGQGFHSAPAPGVKRVARCQTPRVQI